jgi:hypothetical protein
MAAIQYNRVIRKLVVAFGNLFNEIQLVRYKPDMSESERFLIPIAYATKERYVMRLEDDLNLDKKVQVALPRFSFEMTGMTYDATRKQNTNVRNYTQTASGVVGQYNPVPYDFDFNLYLYVRNIEDATQVLEHVLPYFTPDYTMRINMIPELGVVKEVPVIFKDADHEIIYEGDRNQETRMIIWTLRFTAKAFIFGKSSPGKLITHSITNIYNQITPQDVISFTMDPTTGAGDYQPGEIVYQGYSYQTSTASARVVLWDNNVLKLTEINGNFVSDSPIYGINNLASYEFVSYTPETFKYAQIDAYANKPPMVKIDDTEYTMDSSNSSITMDKINTPSVTITESK